MVTYMGVGYKLFKPIVKKYSRIFNDLENSLKIAKLPYNVDEYFAMFLLTEVLAFIFLFPILSLILNIFLKNLAISFVGAFLISLPLLGGIAVLFHIYPSQIYNGKKKKIENIIFFATVYMSTISGTGSPPHAIFNIMSKFGEFGEISKNAGEISKDINIFGLDLADALEHAAERTPSDNLKDLFWGMRSTITSGGDLKEFLDQKSKGFAEEYRRKLEQFTRTLSLFLEMYITIVVVGTIFVLVLTTIMSLVGGFSSQLQSIQMIFIIIGLPLITAVYIVMLKAISPTEV